MAAPAPTRWRSNSCSKACCPRRPPSPESAADLARNAEATRRLATLVARLDASDLERSLGGGWTVGFALAHVAFWEARQEAALRAWLAGAEFPDEDPSVNPTLEAMALTLDPAATAAAVEQLSARVDATIAGLSAEQRAALVDAGFGYVVARWAHREDHIAQIEAVLD
ncbi:MAG: DinB family protein [Chloroflexi bacterium]|nr:DinB family protein [Chloroflexota bacterium]